MRPTPVLGRVAHTGPQLRASRTPVGDRNRQLMLEVAVVGAGAFGRSHIRAYQAQPDVRVTAVVDADEERARTVARLFGLGRYFTSVELMLDAVEPACISVVTSEDAHVAPTLAALRRRIPVLLEKPVGCCLQEVRVLQEAAADADTLVLPGHVLRYAPCYRVLRERVSSGAIGDVVAVAARRDRTQAIARHYTSVHPALLTAVHDIDLVLWITGAKGKRVRAVERRTNGFQPTLVWGQVELSDGVIAAISAAHLHPDTAIPPASDRFEVYGTRGVAVVDLTAPQVSLCGPTHEVPDVDIAPDSGAGALGAEIADFCACVRRGRMSDVVTLDDAFNGISIATAMIRSATADGAVVELD